MWTCCLCTDSMFLGLRLEQLLANLRLHKPSLPHCSLLPIPQQYSVSSQCSCTLNLHPNRFLHQPPQAPTCVAPGTRAEHSTGIRSCPSITTNFRDLRLKHHPRRSQIARPPTYPVPATLLDPAHARTRHRALPHPVTNLSVHQLEGQAGPVTASVPTTALRQDELG